MSAKERVAVLGVTLLAFALRLYHLGDQSLWYDDAHSLLIGEKDPASIIVAIARDTMPPLHYLLLHVWGVRGDDFYLRFPSAFFSALCVPLVYSLSRTLFKDSQSSSYGRAIPLLAALITALSPFQVYFAQETRMYSLLACLTLLAAVSLVRAGWDGRLRWWAVYSLSTVLALYTHSLAGLVLFSVALAAALYFRDTKSFARRLVLWTVISLLALAPWGLVLGQQSARVLGSFWAGQPPVVAPIATLYVFLYGASLPGYLVPLGLFLSVSAAVLPLYIWLRRSGLQVLIRPKQPETFLLLWAGLSIMGLYLISLLRPLYLERVIIGASFPWYIGLALLISKGLPSPSPMPWAAVDTHRWPAALLGIASGILALVGLWDWYFIPAYAKPPLKEAAAYITGNWQNGDTVLHSSDGSYLPFQVYLSTRNNLLLYGDPEYFEGTTRARSTYGALGIEPVKMEDVMGNVRARGQRLWLVFALDHSHDFQREAAQQVDRMLNLVEERNIGGILVRLYEAGG
ncbi:MAG: hypothetical protein EXR50_05220 [Dehalococcoidia bacterium]|nr:hypothetical protein [Dehalococcoidia bacterium]